eukprot:s1613_g30.t1
MPRAPPENYAREDQEVTNMPVLRHGDAPVLCRPPPANLDFRRHRRAKTPQSRTHHFEDQDINSYYTILKYLNKDLEPMTYYPILPYVKTPNQKLVMIQAQVPCRHLFAGNRTACSWTEICGLGQNPRRAPGTLYRLGIRPRFLLPHAGIAT